MRRSVALALAAVAAVASLAVVVVVALEVLEDEPGAGARLAANDDGATDGDTDDSDDTDEPLDQGSFCVAIRDLAALGARPSAGEGTAAQVLAQNAEFAALVEAASSDLPSGAPADVTEFLDDNRALSEAIEAAAGDKDAAVAAMTDSDPELVQRLTQPDAHSEAFLFFSERCGTAPPP